MFRYENQYYVKYFSINC